MSTAAAYGDLFDLIFTTAADRIAAKIISIQKGHEQGKRSRVAKLKGRKLDMQCRAPRCRQRSRGPRFGYFCLNHDRLHRPRAKAAA